jgi:UDP-N-acetylmuramyl pentapeptide synthase
MKDAWEALEPETQGVPCAWLLDREALGSRLSSFVKTGDLVLLKGSRSLEMERLLPRITGTAAPGGILGTRAAGNPGKGAP